MRFAALIVIPIQFFLSNGWAQNLPPAPPYTLIEKAGKYVGIAMSDGREAQLVSRISSLASSPLDLSILENTCLPDQIKNKCKVILRFKAIQLSLAWTKHPDATKLGQDLEYSFDNSNNKTPFREITFAFFGADRLFHSEINDPPYNYEIQCDSWSFIHANTSPAKIEALAITSEDMRRNTESNENLNQTIGSIDQPTLTRNSNGQYELTHSHHIYKSVLIGSTTTFYFSQSQISATKIDKPYCQVHMSIDNTNLQTTASKALVEAESASISTNPSQIEIQALESKEFQYNFKRIFNTENLNVYIQ